MPNTLIGNLQGAQGQGYTWRGAWLSTTAYVPYDTVYQLGSSYNCVLANTGVDPTGDNGTHWQLSARIGDPGPAGLQGVNSFTTTTSAFIVPPVGQSVQVTVVDASWIVPGQIVWIEAGSGQADVFRVTAKTGNTITIISPAAPGPVLPPAWIGWTIQSTPVDNSWAAVAYGNGLFVAVATGGLANRAMTSPDGVNWTLQTTPAANFWAGVAYGNGLFVAVAGTGGGTRAMTSSDGINWTLRTTPANGWTAVTFGNGLFVAVANTGIGNRVMTSPDGINWTSRTTPADITWNAVTYGNGLFVATAGTGTGNRVMTSPDGVNWTLRTTPADNNWYAVTYGNGLFVAVAFSGTDMAMTSPDGVNWTLRTTPTDQLYQWTGLTYADGLFVAVAANGFGTRSMVSPDGVNWTIETTPADNYWRAVTYAHGLFVAVATSGTGNRAMTSGTLRATIPAGGLVSPGGPPGPSAVSADPGNTASLGSDSLIYVPASSARHYNSIGNPTMECDQRRGGNAIAIGANTPLIDRWYGQIIGSGIGVSAQQLVGNAPIPGMNYFVTSKFLRLTVTTAKATLAPTDRFVIYQTIEGPLLRELLGDVHSASILMRGGPGVSAAGFGLSIQDSVGAWTLTSQITTPGLSGTWSWFQLPNLPIWTSSGSFPVTPGSIGYYITITLAAGSSALSPSNDVWVNSPNTGIALGQRNFVDTVGQTFDIAFVQHQPGSVCFPVDKPFVQNLDECQRYFFKTYDYSFPPGAGTFASDVSFVQAGAGGYLVGPFRYAKQMAKTPVVTCYNPSGGAANSINCVYPGGTFAVSTATNGCVNGGAGGFFGLALTAPPAVAAGNTFQGHIVADTGW